MFIFVLSVSLHPPSTVTFMIPHSRLQRSTMILERIPENSKKNEEQFNSLTIPSFPRTSCNGSFYDNFCSLVSVCIGSNGALDSRLGFPCSRFLLLSLNGVHTGAGPCSQSACKVRGCHFHLPRTL